jgi:hypothetical protein
VEYLCTLPNPSIPVSTTFPVVFGHPDRERLNPQPRGQADVAMSALSSPRLLSRIHLKL